ncbi:uncharacterized protein LOC135823945 [Sycon ciliatum]|uniref:uncharacterized protein LOC135823945 n=1 Tax=Sycon ciliatum TaxID=27933 RepID=UPI0031F6AAD3|eukprot:scpid69600/ scgid23860/ 
MRQIIVWSLVLVVSCLAAAWAQMTQPPFPTLPSSFSTEVEANILNRDYTVQVREFFDGRDDRAQLEVTRNGSRTVVIDDIRNGIQYTVDDSRRTCQARNYTLRDRLETLGPDGQPHLISVNDFFRFGKAYHEKYVGQATVRGIVCDQYTGNYTNTTNGMYVSYVMQWYFARQSNWTMPAGPGDGTAIPVRLDLVGVSNITRTQGPPTTPLPSQPLHNFHHVYEFTKFLPNPDFFNTPGNFNPPEGILCTGVPQIYDVPKLPDQFYFQTIAFDTTQEAGYMSGYAYDAVRGETAVVYDLEYTGNGTNLTGTGYEGRHRIVHNFRQGTQYNITTSACSMETLVSVANTPGATDISLLNGHASLNSGSQLFRFSPESNITFQGQRKSIFGNPVQLWSTVRNDVQLVRSLPANQTSLWEYLFTVPQWKINTYDGLLTNTRSPIEIRAFSLEPGRHRPLFVGISGYTVGPPPVEVFETSSCFESDQLSTITFALDAQYRSTRAVRNAVANAVSSTLGVSTDRFHMTLFPGRDNLLNVIVSIQDLPSVGDSSLLATLPTLQTARQKLRDAIKDGKFSLPLPSAGTVKAKSTSYKSSYESSSSSTSYSPAEMAGVGVGVLVLGFICGVILVHVVVRAKGDSVPYGKE